MIIPFAPPESGSHLPAAIPPEPRSSLNWLQSQGEQIAFSNGEPPEKDQSKIVNFAMVYPDEMTPSTNYIEEVKAKRFKGPNSIALFVNEDLFATNRQRRSDESASPWPSLKFLDGPGIIPALESLPDAA